MKNLLAVGVALAVGCGGNGGEGGDADAGSDDDAAGSPDASSGGSTDASPEETCAPARQRLPCVFSDDDNLDGVPDSIETYEFDADGRLVQEITDTDADGLPDSFHSFGYDGAELIWFESTDPEGIVKSRRDYTYDDDGRLLSETIDADPDDDDVVEQVHTYVRNGDGDLVTWTITFPGPDNDDRLTFEYENGRLVGGAFLGEPFDSPARLYEFTYDSDGRLVKTGIDINADEDVDRSFEHAYDLDGREVFLGNQQSPGYDGLRVTAYDSCNPSVYVFDTGPHTIDYRFFLTHDGDGDLVTIERDDENDGDVDDRFTLDYSCHDGMPTPSPTFLPRRFGDGAPPVDELPEITGFWTPFDVRFRGDVGRFYDPPVVF